MEVIEIIMNKKQQIIVIHGGTTFGSAEVYLKSLNSSVVDLDKLRYRKDWKDTLQETLGSTFDVFQPRMPNSNNAQYSEWKIVFEKILDQVDDNVIVVGHSLGALFIVKYLSENNPTRKIRSLFLIASPLDDETDESLGSFVVDSDKVKNIHKRTEKIYFYFSKDDPVVAFSEAEKYMKKFPDAIFRILDGRGHFKQENIPELVLDLQSLL